MTEENVAEETVDTTEQDTEIAKKWTEAMSEGAKGQTQVEPDEPEQEEVEEEVQDADVSEVTEDRTDDRDVAGEKPDRSAEMDYLRNLARASDAMSEERLASFKTPEALQGALMVIADQRESQRKAQEQPKETGFDLKLDPEIVDEPILEAFKTMQSHYDGVVGSMRDQLTSIQGELKTVLSGIQQWSKAQELNTVRGMVDTLEEEIRDVFKKNPIMVDDLYEQMLDTQAGRQRRGRSPLTVEELFRNAVGVMFADKHKELARREVQSKLKKKAASASHRSGSKTEKGDVDPNDKAVAIWDQAFGS